MPHRLGIHAAARYPADPRAVFILALCIAVGLPYVIFGADPSSLDALLPRWAIALWGLALVGGSGVTLFGMSKQTTNGAIIEQVGSVATGVAAVVYGGAILLTAGENALAALPFIWGFGFALFWRWAQLQVWLYEQKIALDAILEDEDA